MRTIEKLLMQNGKVYVRVENLEQSKRFLQNAEKEGFLFADGTKPTESKPRLFYRLIHDKTIEPAGCGFVGTMLMKEIISGNVDGSISINYIRYIVGEENYIDGM